VAQARGLDVDHHLAGTSTRLWDLVHRDRLAFTLELPSPHGSSSEPLAIPTIGPVIEHVQSTPVVGGACQVLRSGVVSYGVFTGAPHGDDRHRTDAALTVTAPYGHGVARY